RRLNALVQVGGPQVHVLVERAPHGQEELVDGDLVGHVRAADRPEQDGVVAAELLPTVLGKHPAGLLVIGGIPGQAVPLGRGRLPARVLACCVLPCACWLAGCSVNHHQVAPKNTTGDPLVGDFGPPPGAAKVETAAATGSGVVPASGTRAALPPLPVTGTS